LFIENLRIQLYFNALMIVILQTINEFD